MKVLLVEDDPSLREGMGEIIAEFVDVRPVASVDSALAALREERFDLVMADLRIAGAATGGRTILEAARRRLQPVAIVSAAEPEEIRQALQPFEADALLAKPFQLNEMTELVERFLSLRDELERLASQRPPEAAWTQAGAGDAGGAGGLRQAGGLVGAHAGGSERLVAGARGPGRVPARRGGARDRGGAAAGTALLLPVRQPAPGGPDGPGLPGGNAGHARLRRRDLRP